jgi:hypothetical protein
MRIAIVVLGGTRRSKHGTPDADRVPTWVVGLTTRLMREHDVILITDLDDSSLPEPARSSRWRAGSLERRHLPRSVAADPLLGSTVRSFAAHIGEIRADVVHAVGELSGRVVDSMGWDCPAPLVWSAGTKAPRRRRGSSTTVWVPTRAEGVIAGTRAELDQLVAAGVQPHRAHLVPVRAWPPTAELEHPINTRVRIKRVCCLLDSDSRGAQAMVRALTDLPTMRLLVVGRGHSDEVASSARDVAVFARNLHVDGRVGVLTDAGDLSLALAMRQADAVALLSPGEPDLPALGTALVSGAVPIVLGGNGAEDLIEHGVSGVLLRTLDPRQLVATLRILDGDPGVRDTMATAARRRAREVYDGDALAAACVKVYRAAHSSRRSISPRARQEIR